MIHITMTYPMTSVGHQDVRSALAEIAPPSDNPDSYIKG